MKYLCLTLLLVGLGGFWYVSAISQPPPPERAAIVPAVPPGAEVITLGIGCFWRGQAIFQQIPGVLSVTVGYMGNHTEVSRVVYDPAKTSLDKILQVFWASHHPTQSNSVSGRSVIFYSNTTQRDVAEKSLATAAKSFTQPIVTEIAPAREFYPAEEFHQNYYVKNGGSCGAVNSPQLQALGIK